MPIPESQLKTWSSQGSITQSSSTYATIKDALEAVDTDYSDKSFDIFLQGSYGNDTNIYAESDVDVVIRLESTFGYDLTSLTSGENQLAKATITPAEYRWHDFYADVNKALVKAFGSSVQPGPKAIGVHGNGTRRSADVLVAEQFRQYRTFNAGGYSHIDYGVCFWDSSGNRIVNYPQQHSENCTAKHQATSQRFKPMVRVFKNVRTKLVSVGLLADGAAPSYFLEGLLYNAPNPLYVASLQNTFVGAYNWVLNTDRKNLKCANELMPLLGNSSVTWREQDLDAFLDAVKTLWNNWE